MQRVASTIPRPCPGCRSEDSAPFAEVKGFPLRTCRGCGTLFTEALPQAQQSHDYEGYYHEANLAVPAFVEERLAQIVGRFDGYRATNRWLDVGCGAGALLRAARRHGWDVTGTEVSSPAAQALRAEGLEILLGDLRELDVGRGRFDVVSLVEVLEHVPDPDEQLAACRELLRPGGVVYVTTPNGRGLSARLLRERWTVVAPPEHLQLYSPRGLREALRRSGLSPERERAEGMDPSAIRTRLRRSPSPAAAGAERVERAYELNERLSSTRRGMLAKRAVNGLLSVLRLGDGLKLVARRPG